MFPFLNKSVLIAVRCIPLPY